MLKMTDTELKSLCILLMCDDPTNLNETERDEIEEFANNEAQEHGFSDWVDAYHIL